MEYDIPYRLIAVILLIAVFTFFLTNLFVFTPRYRRLDEGFASFDTGKMPDCFRTLPEAEQILSLIRSTQKGVEVERLEDTEADDKELEILLQKMACLKADLLSTERLPQSTRALPFETAHDRIPVAEFSGMCMAKNLSPRDIDIVFLTWRDRAQHLLRKLCTERNLPESEIAIAEKQLMTAWDGVYQLSKSTCVGEAPPLHRPQDEAPYEPEHLRNRRTYDYTYGGLSASGWNSNM